MCGIMEVAIWKKPSEIADEILKIKLIVFKQKTN
jgi:hypothetical protein